MVGRLPVQPRPLIPRIGRRAFIGGLAASAALSPFARASDLVPTPAQTEGPFYPEAKPADSDADLVLVKGRARRARGQLLHLFGRVLDGDGKPVPEALVELWQCDNWGGYHHPDAGGGADPDFQGYGRTTYRAGTDYHFRTIKPGKYPFRTPHIHFKVRVPGHVLTTQMYFAGESRNQRDFLYRRLGSPARQAAVTVDLGRDDALEQGALRGRFDIVLS